MIFSARNPQQSCLEENFAVQYIATPEEAAETQNEYVYPDRLPFAFSVWYFSVAPERHFSISRQEDRQHLGALAIRTLEWANAQLPLPR